MVEYRNMKKVVIAGSAKLQKEINIWLDYFTKKLWNIKVIDEQKFMNLYPNILTCFLKNIMEADILFIMNEDKNGISGYIGYEIYAELLFGLSQNWFIIKILNSLY